MNTRLKRIVKKMITACSCLAGYKSKLDVMEAERLLHQYHARPAEGKCIADNQINIQYDLHIIIPVYNGEKYVESCLKSVIGQVTKYRFIVTVVNDGSKDTTANILKKYEDYKIEGGSAVEIITQDNRGFSGARNRGMETIRGQYVLFLDADDLLAENAIETMIQVAYDTNADILQGGWYEFTTSNSKPEHEIVSEHKLSNNGMLSNTKGCFSGYPWGKLYKYTVLEHFQFPEGFWFEDTPISFLLQAMPYRFAVVSDIVYGYRVNPEGITAKAPTSKKSIDSYWITEECLKEFPAFSSYIRSAGI